MRAFAASVLFFAAASVLCLAQNTDGKPLPIIDVHVPTPWTRSFPGLGPMCPNTPKFLASDPKTKEAPFGWVTDSALPPRSRPQG